MNEFSYKLLREKSWRRKLTSAEEASVRAWLAEHPEAKADWELESKLSEALGKLSDAPVPSNFTARVRLAIERETVVAPRRPADRLRWILRLLPRAAVAAAVLGIGVFTYHRHEHVTAQRAELVQGVKVVTGVSSLPGPEILQDFDTIRQMSTTPGPDPELIALMK